MNPRVAQGFRRTLLRQRQALFAEVAHVEADLHALADERESELEEAAQDERTTRLLSRLDNRGKAELEAIDDALERLAAGAYGVCLGCGATIPRQRLTALPATPSCRGCAERAERGEREESTVEEPPRSGPVPGEYSLLSASELEEAVREHVRDDGRVDLEELRIVCHHGVVYLGGALPSEKEHKILLHTVTDVMGLMAVTDRVQVKEILWERDDRSKEDIGPETKRWDEPPGTEDVTEATEQGIDFVAPGEPVPDEE